MSWIDPPLPPEPLEILVHGYIREQKKVTSLTIAFPDDVKHLIYLFYPKKCTVYGIGANNYNELGMQGKLTAFHELEAFNKLSIQPQDIFTGYSRFTVKTHEDRIYSIGNNYNGDCGCGREETQIEELKEIDMSHVDRNFNGNFVECVSSGTNHMLFVLNNIIYATGQNGYGQCGNNDINTLYIPIPINKTFNNENNRIVQIECGYNHSILLNINGMIYSCGRNEDFQCGINTDSDDIKIFKTIQHIKCNHVQFQNISVGGYHNLCISRENKLYIFGKNTGNELGVYDEQQTHFKIPTVHKYFVQRDKKIIFTSTKHEHCMAVDSDYICYLWGSNVSHQISKKQKSINDIIIFQKEYNEFKKTKIKNGSCGYNHTLLLTLKDHNVIGFGGNDYQQTNPLSQNKITKDPHTFNNMEIGIKYEQRIVRVIAAEYTTILIQQ